VIYIILSENYLNNMGRGKSMVRQIMPKNIDKEEWYTMFMQMMGSEVDIDIIYPKYKIIWKDCQSVIKNMLKFASPTNFLLKLFPELEKGMKEITFFCNQFRDELGEFKSHEEMVKEGTKDNSYITLKNSKYIKNLIITRRNLQDHDQYIKSEDQIKENIAYCERFIYDYPGPELTIFPFSSFELKNIWDEPRMKEHPQVKTYILTCLTIFNDKIKKIVKLTLSADVDVKGFSGAVSSQLTAARKQIRYCDKAFDKIEQSIDLLEDNFDGYYQDMVRSKNPNLIVENFVLDVSKQQKHDRKTTIQFKKIMQFYRKNTEGKTNDPRLQQLFKLLDKNFSLLDKDTEKSASAHVPGFDTDNKDAEDIVTPVESTDKNTTPDTLDEWVNIDKN